jgi:hypothetical protein
VVPVDTTDTLDGDDSTVDATTVVNGSKGVVVPALIDVLVAVMVRSSVAEALCETDSLTVPS